ncbi:hypothetical protein RCO28_01635 [Streptomyces sp. LHD-70]|uniref:hypothetical protein n=1 Tax=Streptomyces sp. LHD-70 TaxID=3072140 RepID=UPI00280E08E2|nr:hypothetical protein [Streptomyces sp. LHD-70]MDQ8701189.1 hypothetical protein [Streptomyces sp. LHD-70]
MLRQLRSQRRRRTARRALLLREASVDRNRRRNLGEALVTVLLVAMVIVSFSALIYQVVTRP